MGFTFPLSAPRGLQQSLIILPKIRGAGGSFVLGPTTRLIAALLLLPPSSAPFLESTDAFIRVLHAKFDRGTSRADQSP